MAGPLCAQTKDKARVSSITVRKLTVTDGDPSKLTLAIEVTGDKLGSAETSVKVTLINLDTGTESKADVTKHDQNKIFASVLLPVAKDPVKYEFRVMVGDASAIAEGHLSDYTVEVKKEKEPDPKPKAFEITFESFKSEEYPNLHSLLITNKTQGNDPGFSSNPAMMKVDIVPPGATNVTIQPGGNPYQMLVTFLAPEKFEPKGVVLTVFDPNSTLANNQPKAYSTPFREKEKKADPNQPVIEDIAILSMQRHSGYGTVRIKGSGFGDYERPPISGEKELLCCLNRPSNPNIADEQEDRRESWEKRTKEAKEEKKEPALRPGETRLDDLVVKDSEVCRVADSTKCTEMAEWRRRIEERVNVTLLPRNPDLRIERTQIMHIDERVIDVYFEFSRFEGYSSPMRLENATVTINKGAVKEAATSDAASKFTAVLSGPQTFVATKAIGPPRDQNLEYRYTVLNQADAKNLFGGGVGESFFVIELAVVNNGKKKVAIPLGSIQAEAAWLYGFGRNKKEFFDEGPPTLPALPLGAVSGYFDAYQKSKGKWAKLFNILDGVGTLAATMVPIIRELERPTLILGSGLVPALKKSIGDLSSEQIARLTSLSWENVEEIVPGGSKTKFIYIPRADQFFGNANTKENRFLDAKDTGVEYKTRKQVINIIGLEVAGFEVTESEKKTATEQETPKP